MFRSLLAVALWSIVFAACGDFATSNVRDDDCDGETDEGCAPTCSQTLCVTQPERTVPEIVFYPETREVVTHHLRLIAGVRGAVVQSFRSRVEGGMGGVMEHLFEVRVSRNRAEQGERRSVTVNPYRGSGVPFWSSFSFQDPLILDAGEEVWVSFVYVVVAWPPFPEPERVVTRETVILSMTFMDVAMEEWGTTCGQRDGSSCWFRSGAFRIEYR